MGDAVTGRITARISVTIHENTTVSNSISATLLPRLLAKLVLIMNGSKIIPKTTTTGIIPGASNPNMVFAPLFGILLLI